MDPKKLRGKRSSYAFFVQTCREEHKKKRPNASVNFSEFSKKCSERWKTMSAQEKGKLEDMAKADKARYEREMKTYIPPKGETKKKFRDPNAPKRPPPAFFLFCSEYRPKIKGEHPGLPTGDVAKKLGERWHHTTADDKQPYEKKAADTGVVIAWKFKQVLVGAQHKLVIYGDGSFSSSVVSDAAYTK
uniref:High mobility group protein B1 n=1 Tax=Urocitellus parryii TaxID=9999 RepID=A0A8D2HBC7_UROPR